MHDMDISTVDRLRYELGTVPKNQSFPLRIMIDGKVFTGRASYAARQRFFDLRLESEEDTPCMTST